jgi:hypothetical protein
MYAFSVTGIFDIIMLFFSQNLQGLHLEDDNWHYQDALHILDRLQLFLLGK